MSNALPIYQSLDELEEDQGLEDPLSSQDEVQMRINEPVDPVSALGCDNFICFLSKYDIVKTENGYMVFPVKVIGKLYS